MPTPVTPLRIGLAVAEPSGDILAAGMMRELRVHEPGIEFWGIGGELMQREGMEVFASMDDITLMGLDARVRKIASIWRLRQRFATIAATKNLDAYVGVDAPDFNLTVEAKLKTQGVPTVHYVSPSVWAWRGYRVKKIRASVDRILTLFPFEQRFYEANNMAATYVGHPAAKAMRALSFSRAREGMAKAGETLIALLPGSRYSEVSRLLDAMLDAAHLLHTRNPGLRFVLPVAKPALRGMIDTALAAHPALPVTLLDGESRRALKAADFTLIASGTATLEALLAGTPMVVVYQVSPRTEWMVKKWGHVEHYSLPNHLLPTPQVPELVQEAMTAENIAGAMQVYLDDAEKTRALKQDFAAVATELEKESDQLAAQAVLAEMGMAVRQGA